MNPVSSFRQPNERVSTILSPLVSILLLLHIPLTEAQQPAAIVSGSSTAAPVSLDTYTALRTPSVTLTTGTFIKGSLAAKLANLTAQANNSDTPATPSLLQPQARNGVFDEVNLGYLDGSGKAPPPVNVTLQFDASRAEVTVWVQPLDGGTILAQDANGKSISSPAGCTVVLDASGQLVFGYQALALPGRYQVLIRLDNISTILPFVIPDPSQGN